MSPGAVMTLAILFGTFGAVGIALMIWARLLNPEQLTIREEDEE